MYKGTWQEEGVELNFGLQQTNASISSVKITLKKTLEPNIKSQLYNKSKNTAKKKLHG